ncbi:MAG: hypothetical protein IKP87_08860 [Victivallales bacterium]|nr:hypothetical protein [Victivallales bacterium]
MVDWPTAGRRRCIGTALDGGTPSLHRHGARRRDAVATSAQHSTAGRRRYTGRRRH